MVVGREGSFLASLVSPVVIGWGMWANQMGDIVSCDFNKASCTVSNKNIIWKLSKSRVDGRVVKRAESLQVCQAEAW